MRSTPPAVSRLVYALAVLLFLIAHGCQAIKRAATPTAWGTGTGLVVVLVVPAPFGILLCPLVAAGTSHVVGELDDAATAASTRTSPAALPRRGATSFPGVSPRLDTGIPGLPSIPLGPQGDAGGEEGGRGFWFWIGAGLAVLVVVAWFVRRASARGAQLVDGLLALLVFGVQALLGFLRRTVRPKAATKGADSAARKGRDPGPLGGQNLGSPSPGPKPPG